MAGPPFFSSELAETAGDRRQHWRPIRRAPVCARRLVVVEYSSALWHRVVSTAPPANTAAPTSKRGIAQFHLYNCTSNSERVMQNCCDAKLPANMVLQIWS